MVRLNIFKLWKGDGERIDRFGNGEEKGNNQSRYLGKFPTEEGKEIGQGGYYPQ